MGCDIAHPLCEDAIIASAKIYKKTTAYITNNFV